MHLGKFAEYPGGVARNIADALNKLDCPSIFLSAIGEDTSSKIITSTLPLETTKYIRRISKASTAQSAAIFDTKGECRLLLGDMEIHKEITPDFIKNNEDIIKNAPLIILDANPTIATLEAVLKIAEEHQIPVFFEPTDVVISEKPFRTKHWKAIKYISPNINELKHLAKIFGYTTPLEDHKLEIEDIACIAKFMAQFIDNVIVTLGENGILVARYANASTSFLTTEKNKLQIRHYSTSLVQKIVNVQGAGDCLVSGVISSILKGLNEEQCVTVGFQAALSALQSFSAVPNRFEINTSAQTVKYKTIL